MDKKKYQIPQGTEVLGFEETKQHQQLKSLLDEIFQLWGYQAVETPLFDFFDPYAAVLGKELLQKSFRLIDREGDLLLLRPDMTLFLARQMGFLLQQKKLPLRVFYDGPIMRFEDPSDISANEFYQMGAELVGASGSEADLEILLLCFKILEKISLLKQSRLHLGNHAFYDAVFSSCQNEEKGKVMEIIRKRDFDALAAFFKKENINPEKYLLYIQLFSFIGKPDELEEILSPKNRQLLNKEEQLSLDYLLDISKKLEKYSYFLRLDLSESGSQAYHSGIVFQVYCRQAATAVLSGGRYDKLLGKFNAEMPSLGFSLFPRKIEKLLSFERQKSEVKKLFYNQANFMDKQQEAEKLRAKGTAVILCKEKNND